MEAKHCGLLLGCAQPKEGVLYLCDNPAARHVRLAFTRAEATAWRGRLMLVERESDDALEISERTEV